VKLVPRFDAGKAIITSLHFINHSLNFAFVQQVLNGDEHIILLKMAKQSLSPAEKK